MHLIKDKNAFYMSLALANELFSGPYYNFTYTGEALIGYDMLDLRDDTFSEKEYPNHRFDEMSTAYKAQTYHYFALVLDMFYGLDQYFNIDDIYDVLAPNKTLC